MRTCRREPVERTPVWFMRQAGRSLPEYREVRRSHTLFEICRVPDLCAEVTLQPVRRHGVDAAVMFADIMLPVLGMGIEVELVEGVGPVVARPIETLARRRGAAHTRAGGGGSRASSRPFGSCGRNCRAGAGGGRLLRRAVHGGRLPGRGSAEPGLHSHEVVHVQLARGLARAARQAGRDLGAVRGGAGAGRSRRRAGVRLLGRRALGERLPRVRRDVLGAHPRRGRRADDPLRDGSDASAAGARGRRAGT